MKLGKKENFEYKQFELENKKDEKSKLTASPKWLSSKKDFNEAAKLIEDIRADTNTARSSSGNNVFSNYLNGLINDLKKKKLQRKVSLKK